MSTNLPLTSGGEARMTNGPDGLQIEATPWLGKPFTCRASIPLTAIRAKMRELNHAALEAMKTND